MKAKERLDKIIVDRGIVKSRERAKALIMAGHILVDSQKVTKAGALISLITRLINDWTSFYLNIHAANKVLASTMALISLVSLSTAGGRPPVTPSVPLCSLSYPIPLLHQQSY